VLFKNEEGPVSIYTPSSVDIIAKEHTPELPEELRSMLSSVEQRKRIVHDVSITDIGLTDKPPLTNQTIGELQPEKMKQIIANRAFVNNRERVVHQLRNTTISLAKNCIK